MADLPQETRSYWAARAVVAVGGFHGRPDWEQTWWDHQDRQIDVVPLPEPAALSRLLASERIVRPARVAQPALFELGAVG